MANLRVLQAMAGARHGGAEGFFTRLVPALARAGLEQKVIIRRDRERAAALRAEGVEPLELPFGGRLDLRTPFALKKELRAFRPHVVLTWMNRAADKMPARVRGSDFVHVGRLGGYYDLKYYRHCGHLIGNTLDIVEYLKGEGWPGDRAHYLPNFVHQETAPPVPRKAHFTPPGEPLLLALGRLHQNKAFDVLIRAMVRLPDAYLWLAGEGPERAALEELAEKLSVKPRVRFLGWRDDAAALFAAADILVCPSRHEPLGNVVVEGWAQGVPVVAAASQGPAALIEDGVSGLLAPVDDADALAQAISRALEDRNLMASMADGGRRAFANEFSEPVVVRQYLDFFERLAADQTVKGEA